MASAAVSRNARRGLLSGVATALINAARAGGSTLAEAAGGTGHAASYLLNVRRVFSAGSADLARDKSLKEMTKLFLTFVIGGPGSGKGTQCEKIVETFGYAHISAGDLLRREISLNTEHGKMILETVKEGKIVPSHVTVNLILKEIKAIENNKFLIDGFPRNDENRVAFESIMEREPDSVIFFDCPEEVMIKRVLARNQGRIDDNIETIRKRLLVFYETHFPILNYYSEKGKLYKVNAVGSVDEIFDQVRPIFSAHV